MKKVISAALALALVFALGTSAFAATTTVSNAMDLIQYSRKLQNETVPSADGKDVATTQQWLPTELYNTLKTQTTYMLSVYQAMLQGVTINIDTDTAYSALSKTYKTALETVKYGTMKESDTGMPYTDVAKEDAFCEAIKFMYDNGYMNGTGDTTFSPNASVNRGMAVTVLWRMCGSPATEASDFTDVAATDWFATAVAWAKAESIVNGTGEGKFSPNNNLKAYELDLILTRYTAKFDSNYIAGTLSGQAPVSRSALAVAFYNK